MHVKFVAALFVLTSAFAAPALADGGISAATLSAMGLDGVTLVNDSVADDVRGMGYAPKGFALAAGGSIAYVGHPSAGAGSVNVYAALGGHYASGNNFSEAGKTVTKTTSLTIGELTTTKTVTNSLRVYAGGFSSSVSF